MLTLYEFNFSCATLTEEAANPLGPELCGVRRRKLSSPLSTAPAPAAHPSAPLAAVPGPTAACSRAGGPLCWPTSILSMCDSISYPARPHTENRAPSSGLTAGAPHRYYRTSL